MEEEELMDPSTWDYDRPERIEGRPGERYVVLAVRFTQDEFEHISKRAKKLRRKTTAFVHDAAVEALSG